MSDEDALRAMMDTAAAAAAVAVAVATC